MPKSILVAVWGLESNFGRFTGVRPTVPVLATLAYDGRRATLFRGELLSALRILDRGDIELDRLKGSWAGAMGQPQFLPSSYLKFAQDFDGDGRRDIWTSLPDVFASIAAYMASNGWTPGESWGPGVTLPAISIRGSAAKPAAHRGLPRRRQLTEPMLLREWAAVGVRTARGSLAEGVDAPRCCGWIRKLPGLSQLRDPAHLHCATPRVAVGAGRSAGRPPRQWRRPPPGRSSRRGDEGPAARARTRRP